MLNTGQNTADNFWFRARMVTHCWQEPDLPGPGFDEVKAAIHYTSKRRGKAAVSRPSTRRAVSSTAQLSGPICSNPPYIDLLKA
ncbi:hypothetical protein M7I_7241 [Glarea lozoyensis 74030]|uniref:Uncharacterized protein n=1 Tax=Glarea lozoyensis (strain ATCC 74030 / MF5533) TaxID=1104152 RepID=H0EWR8_GLAL7|nr:hypothetical protein M7I_7241 [Glarea lozoyensis 74030]